MIEAIDSFFKYVKARIVAANPARTVVGVIEGSAWPPKNVIPNGIYLLLLGEVTPSSMYNASAMGMSHLVQWVWIIPGDDLTQTQAGNNRGNRYRTNYQIKKELQAALFPGFCDKQSFTAQQQGATVVTTPQLMGEKIWWTPPRWMPSKFEDKSGIIYGAAQLYINHFSDVITS